MISVGRILKTAEKGITNAARYAKEALPLRTTTPIKTLQKTENILKSTSDKDLGFYQPVIEKWMKFGIKMMQNMPFSTKTEVALIEKSLAQKGVFARFKNDIELAEVVQSALAKVETAGFKLPKYIILDGSKKTEGKVLQFRSKNASESPLFLSKNYISQRRMEIEANKQAFEKHGINVTSTDSMDGIVCHEIIHWQHFHNAPDKKTCEKIWKTVNEKKVVPEVSFSVLQDKAGKEFVAEVGAGLLNGKTYSDYVMDIYKQLKGPMPKSLSENRSVILNA